MNLFTSKYKGWNQIFVMYSERPRRLQVLFCDSVVGKHFLPLLLRCRTLYFCLTWTQREIFKLGPYGLTKEIENNFVH